jgi:hypothetical protein
MAGCNVSNFALDCGEGSGCAILVVRDGEAIDKAIFICATNPQMGVFLRLGASTSRPRARQESSSLATR